MGKDTVQTRLEQWKGAEYPDKRPRCKIMNDTNTEHRSNPSKAWLFVLVGLMLLMIYLF